LLLKDFPKELYNLDVLDGSPPCSTFSMSGSREKAWGKEKRFREGQHLQTLDDLFFDFIALAQKLKPRIIISENVKGLIQGNAKGYVSEIVQKLNLAGYDTQIFLLNASTMGVPQRRLRVFFLSRRKDLNLPEINIKFNEPPILFGQVRSKEGSTEGLSNSRGELIKFRLPMDKSINDINLRLNNKTSGFNARIRHDDEVCRTITSGEIDYRYFDGKVCTKEDYINCGSFPQDYNFLNIKPKYLIGMSVPPVMMAQVANQVYEQWLKKL
jgi:DNA (cytosine-5)-methyltransferase 1